ncbi:MULTISPECIES: BlaI/MecI/CopY family transcriptional regulator [Nocardioides]|uniref:BlaI/MecI/CopY family transcriptional regulator n=1 Tax=Nocardioides TaxID=1839 RepID=UPI00032DBC21|nr:MULTISPECIES: BlaI/MecI/CopY family transcriptional regulator [Nocardioides]EON25785.1 transcriptional regulator [Nocardioides sp. CF8]
MAYGDLERAVLDVLWEADPESWLTVREVHAALTPARDVAYTTVMTVMERLARKQHIVQRKDGRAYLYRPRASRSEMVAELLNDTLDDFSTHDRQSALVAFVEDASPDDVAALRAALARLEGA